MTINLLPYFAVGDIKLRDNKTVVRAFFEDNFVTSSRNTSQIDFFNNNQIGVEYENEEVCFVGINYPLEVEYNGTNLSVLDYEEIYELFSSVSHEKYGDENSLTFMDIGIAFYFEGDIGGKKIPLQVGIFSKGYYKDYMNTFIAID